MGEADDNDVLQVIKQEVKRRREAIEMYQKAGRTDLLRTGKGRAFRFRELFAAFDVRGRN